MQVSKKQKTTGVSVVSPTINNFLNDEIKDVVKIRRGQDGIFHIQQDGKDYLAPKCLKVSENDPTLGLVWDQNVLHHLIIDINTHAIPHLPPLPLFLNINDQT